MGEQALTLTGQQGSAEQAKGMRTEKLAVLPGAALGGLGGTVLEKESLHTDKLSYHPKTRFRDLGWPKIFITC